MRVLRILLAVLVAPISLEPALAANVVAKTANKWPTRTIPVVICDPEGDRQLGSAICRRQAPRRGDRPRSARLTDQQADLIRTTMRRWNEHYSAHLKLIEVDGPSARNTLVFRRSSRPTRCSTQKIGYDPNQRLKYISIGNGCGRGSRASTNMGVVAHEILHAVGIYHEQQRYDGKRMARVRKVGAKARQWRSVCDPQIKRCRSDDVQGKAVGGYDFASVMHYSVPRSKAKLTTAGKKRLREQGLQASEVGQRNWLSPADERGLRALYPASLRNS